MRALVGKEGARQMDKLLHVAVFWVMMTVVAVFMFGLAWLAEAVHPVAAGAVFFVVSSAALWWGTP